MNNFGLEYNQDSESQNGLYEYEEEKCRVIQSKLSKFLNVIKNRQIKNTDETTLSILKINSIIDSLEYLLDDLYYSDNIKKTRKQNNEVTNQLNDFHNQKRLLASLFPLFMMMDNNNSTHSTDSTD